MDLKQIIFSDFLSDTEVKELLEHNKAILQDFLKDGDIEKLRERLTESRDELVARYELTHS